MSIYIDPPTWPAHGTVFSHLISDVSLAELHEFAAAAGISERAFDRDHYDVPAHLYEDLVRAGAKELSGAQLTRTLIASGLRIPHSAQGAPREDSPASASRLGGGVYAPSQYAPPQARGGSCRAASSTHSAGG